ncbi:MAG: ferrous iron transport protein B [Oscillospiraceae bacterium]|nr:ferrous iron transport protein B [Oscillospiraceae bacterium]
MSGVYALAGNPNSGKTTLFNKITGSNQHVGNWPGVTVEKKEGYIKPRWADIRVVDLPGLYSLSPCSAEERAARSFLIDDRPDVIINVVDATNLERSLYLTLQLAEMGCPMVIALNMTDMLKKSGLEINVKLLEERLGVPVCPISSRQGRGIRELLEIAQKHPYNKFVDGREKIYPKLITYAIEEVEKLISSGCKRRGIPKRFAAVRLFDDDDEICNLLKLNEHEKICINKIMREPEFRYGEHDMIIAEQKYKYICRLCNECVVRTGKSNAPSGSEIIDRVVTNKYVALPLFLAVMVFVFYTTFGSIGAWLSESLESTIYNLAVPSLNKALVSAGAADWAVSLVCDGILGGVGSVVAFLPQLFLLFFFLTILEDSGYMARAAFLMDKPLNRAGLSGRSFVPLLMGFGCTVSGVMAARTLNSMRERRMTILLTPFLSCSAKMPVYAMFIGAFFPKQMAVPVVVGLYAMGLAAAAMAAGILQKTLFKKEDIPFLMELPPYRLPTPKTLWRSMSRRVWDFMVRAGTVLLLASVSIWFMREFDFSLHRVASGYGKDSILAGIGRLLVPILKPLGIGFWQAAVALVTGLIAKEAIVGTLTILYHPAAGTSISAALQQAFTPISALSFLVFVLLYSPCLAAFSTMRRELHSTKLALGWSAVQTGIAWAAAFMVYQFGSLAVNLISLI